MSLKSLAADYLLYSLRSFFSPGTTAYKLYTSSTCAVRGFCFFFSENWPCAVWDAGGGRGGGFHPPSLTSRCVGIGWSDCVIDGVGDLEARTGVGLGYPPLHLKFHSGFSSPMHRVTRHDTTTLPPISVSNPHISAHNLSKPQATRGSCQGGNRRNFPNRTRTNPTCRTHILSRSS